MLKTYKTTRFARWFRKLSDRQTRARIQARIDRLAQGDFGDVESGGDGVEVLPIPHGSGYRIYFTQRSSALVMLLADREDAPQRRNIRDAEDMSWELEFDDECEDQSLGFE